MELIDALLFSALGIQNISGIWQNSTEYDIGDRALDTSNSVVYECAVLHTSATSGTFAAARTANPSYWFEVGVDAATLDGEDGTYYLNLANHTGALPASSVTSGTYTFNAIRLTSGTDVDLTSTAHAFQIGLSSGVNLAIDNTEIQARNNGAASTLSLNQNGGNVAFGDTIGVAERATFSKDVYVPTPNGVTGLYLGPSTDSISGRLFLVPTSGNAAALLNVGGTININFGGTYGTSSGTAAVLISSSLVDIAHGFLVVADGSGDGEISNNAGEVITIDNTNSRIGFGVLGAAVGYVKSDGITMGRADVITSAATSGTGSSMSFDGLLAASRTANPALLLKRSNNGQIALFANGTTTVGNISITASATAYNTSSDARFKDNIALFLNSGPIIDALNTVSYNWKSDGSFGIGFIAQDVEPILPSAVSTDDSPEAYKSIDYSKFVPVIMAELKNIRKLITYNHMDNVLDGVAFLPLTGRQFYLALYLETGKLEEDIDALLNQLTDPSRTIAKIEKKHCMFFLRTHKLVDQIGAGLGLTKEQVNALWKKAEGL
jgi:hypothetical protein